MTDSQNSSALRIAVTALKGVTPLPERECKELAVIVTQHAAAGGIMFCAKALDLVIARYSAAGGGAMDAAIAACKSGEWVKIVRQAQFDLDERESERVADAGRSGMRWVSETNPYGWAFPEPKRPQDHDRPGEWNPFRQCYNLTVDEARAYGITTYKRRGCSRYEVLGADQQLKGWRPGSPPSPAGRAPTPHYDVMAVARASGMLDPGEVEASTHGVYGEPTS